MSNEEKIQLLKRKRTVIKSACTRCKTYVDAFENTTSNIAELKIRYEKLNQSWSQYDQVQAELEELDDSEMSNREIFETAYFSLSSRIQVILEQATDASPSTSNERTRHIQSNSHIRLPKISLPSFSGSYLEWISFHDTFQSLIHTNPSITNIDRFHYLKSSLTGEAAEIIQSLEISQDNYETAWETLKERYNNTRLIIQNHIKSIFDLPTVIKENHFMLRQIVDGTLKHIRALKALGRQTDAWDDIIMYILSTKIDNLTLKEWQTSLTGTDVPTLKQMTDFLLHKCQALETVSKRPYSISSINNNTNYKQIHNKNTTTHVSTFKEKCSYCNDEHFIFHCKRFLSLSPEQRFSEAKSHKLCINCLRNNNHSVKECTSGSCKKCNKKHNTLLHRSEDKNSSDPTSHCTNVPNVSDQATTNTMSTHASISSTLSHVLLSTALVVVYDHRGNAHHCRALLDSGSQSNFVTEELVSRLQLKPEHMNVSISGIGQVATHAKRKVQISLHSRHNAFQTKNEYIVINKITDNLPSSSLPTSCIRVPKNIKLADPNFYISSNIDLLIGAEIFWQLLCVGQIRQSDKHPVLQKTHFGWIISGKFTSSRVSAPPIHHCHLSISNEELDNKLSQFWQLENISKQHAFTKDEKKCEDHFLKNIKRTSQGRFIVRLPVKEDKIIQLGESRSVALKRFYSLERRFKGQPSLKAEYSSFMSEYLSLGHMKKINKSEEFITSPHFYLPHHGVVKNSSITTKLRVVFDGSCKTSSGISLNESLMTGPVVQQDLFSVIVRFRTFRYVLNADITKMYRQILVDSSHIPLQRILWRNDETKPIDTFELTTVTYGTTPASFLSTRCLIYLSEIERKNYPHASKIIARDFYIDDLLTGANSIQEAKDLRDQIIIILKRGCFQLRKWASNAKELLQDFPNDSCQDSLLSINKDANDRTLGMQWDSKEDNFQFAVSINENKHHVTKRIILGRIAQIFDPIGLIGPIITLAKIIMQQLWQLKIDWDASVPINIHTEWQQFEMDLQDLSNLKVPRLAVAYHPYMKIQLHGFCDASMHAYGACIYIRTTNEQGVHSTRLLCSKSRIAPLKCTSIPRLELCGAVLLAQLMDKVKCDIALKFDQMYYWCDSSIVLAWLKSTSRKWNVFVSNRIGEIHQYSNPEDWRHVPTRDNPADVISRGVMPSQLANSLLWWQGPTWLQLSNSEWPDSPALLDLESLPEKRKTTVNLAMTSNPIIKNNLFERYSDLNKLIRITTLCRRFYRNVKSRQNREVGRLSVEELDEALHILCKQVQLSCFTQELEALLNKRDIHAKSHLISLTPFVDQRGLIRVGGRLKNSSLPYAAKHQILLPANHNFTKLIIRYEHIKNLHAGPQATLAAVRLRFWPLSARNTVRKITRTCITCFKIKPSMSQYMMGNLPAPRVHPARPFDTCGVDYGGPLYIREGRRRNAKLTKAYICIFVCFSTKAVHIELVGDMSSEAFINALKRFMSRRGKVSHIYSDNGTNFTGASRELHELHSMFHNEHHKEQLYRFLSADSIVWHFIPPNSPNFGGLWEAAIKSAKHHFKRIVGGASLNYEEMYTLLAQIEAVLNSRPITILSDNPNDYSFLSPGHFLIGETLNSSVEPNLMHFSTNRLSRWQRVEQLRQQFWKRWSTEYLQQMQQRTKWQANKGQQLQPGQMVLVQQPGLAPLQWILGRISEVHPGSDGVVRTATISTSKGNYDRPLSKLSILPLDL